MGKVILLFLFSACTHLFYQPSQQQYTTPQKFKINFDSYFIPSSDGISLHAWHLKNQQNLVPPKGLLLFFHGNAENISSHFLALSYLTEYGYDLLVFDYRGYGQSGGKPSPKGIQKDALSVLEYAVEMQKKMQTKFLFVYGQSLGGAIALRALEDFPQRDAVDLLILDSTFSSYQDLAFDKLKSFWPLLPFSPLAYLLVSDEVGPKKYKDLKGNLSPVPLLVIHGDADEIVPLKFGEEIFENYQLGQKWFWKIPQGGHINAFHMKNGKENYREKFRKFLSSDIWRKEAKKNLSKLQFLAPLEFTTPRPQISQKQHLAAKGREKLKMKAKKKSMKKRRGKRKKWRVNKR